MAEKKTGQYLKYAIGEIFLVVVGILIALSINNWNELRKTRQEEHRYLLALKEEFGFNKDALNNVVSTNQANLQSALELINYTGPDTPQLTEVRFDSLLYGVITNEVQYRPSPGVINEITNAGKLGNFSDPNLKKALASWEAILERIRFQEYEEVLRSRNGLFEFLYDKSNSRRSTYDHYGTQVGFGPSKFKGSNLKLLQIEEFENRMLEFVFTSSFLDTHYYPELEKKIDLILKLIDDNIQK